MVTEQDLDTCGVIAALNFHIPCQAPDLDSAKRAYFGSNTGTMQERGALHRWLELCTTIAETLEVYAEVAGFMDYGLLAAQRTVNLCATPEDLQTVHFTDDNEKAIWIRRMAEFYKLPN
jgi:hypothetical protein